ncbi:MAG: hypothetical protein U0271_08485 [Polyangiaceae bacterium]
MLLAPIIATLAVLLGTAVGVSGGAARRWLGPIQIAGLAAGTITVFFVLLPEAVHHLGWLALAPFAAAMLTASGLERWVGRKRHRVASTDHDHDDAPLVGLELGFLALVVHQVIEAIAMGALGASDEHSLGVVVALGGHTVPIVAALAITVRAARGTRSAIGHGAALAGVTVAGVVLGQLPSAQSSGALERLLAESGWMHAVVAGLLLHAVLDMLGPALTDRLVIERGNGSRGFVRVRATLADVVGMSAGAILGGAPVLAQWEGVETHGPVPGFVVVIAGAVIAFVAHKLMPHAGPTHSGEHGSVHPGHPPSRRALGGAGGAGPEGRSSTSQNDQLGRTKVAHAEV